MSAAKHTAGPWVHHAEDNIITTHDGRLTLEWQARSNHALSRGMSTAERDANARLIAAAPELLAAAQKALAECCDLAETDAGRALEAAIAKATGGQQ